MSHFGFILFLLFRFNPLQDVLKSASYHHWNFNDMSGVLFDDLVGQLVVEGHMLPQLELLIIGSVKEIHAFLDFI